ncbi:MAG TPA: DUF3368 domain-containing protein [Thermomicrobiales bacterium]|jgi:predicted nucleic acid-binding protein
MTWVLDTTVLLYFGRFESLWIIKHALIDPKLVVDEVVAELLRPPTAVNQLQAALTDGWLRRHPLSSDAELASLEALHQQRPRLGSGEAGGLAACIANGWALVSDDQDARRVATTHGVPVTGTIGTLLRAIRREIIEVDPAEALLRRMIEAGYRSPVAQLANLLDCR